MDKTLISLAVAICCLPTAHAATNYVVGSGVIEANLRGDTPPGNETIDFRLSSEGEGLWVIQYIARWYDENETWPFAFQYAALDDVEEMIRPLNQTVRIQNVWDVPVFLFVVGNYTRAPIRPLDQEPHLFFRVDRSEVAFAYDSKWPLATVWCDPDCPNLRGDVSNVMLELGKAKVGSDVKEHAMYQRLSAMEESTIRSRPTGMSPENATLALAEANSLRVALEATDDELQDTLTLYRPLRLYPRDLERPFEAFREESYARAIANQGGSLRRLDAIEARLSLAMQLEVFQTQAEQVNRAEATATAAVDAANRGTLLATIAVAAILSFEFIKWLFPESTPLKNRVYTVLKNLTDRR